MKTGKLNTLAVRLGQNDSLSADSYGFFPHANHQIPQLLAIYYILVMGKHDKFNNTVNRANVCANTIQWVDTRSPFYGSAVREREITSLGN